MRLASLMLVGPGEADRHLERCIRAARGWADTVVVYGDDPDVATRGLIGSYASCAQISDEPLFERSEHLARNRLLELADRYLDSGDIVVVLDADEQLRGTRDEIRAVLEASAASRFDSWNVRILHLWDEAGTLHRVDGAWQPSIGARIYRHQPGYRVEPHPGAWTCSPLPNHLLYAPGPPVLEVLHWSYARERDRAPKHARYTRLTGHSSTHVDSILAAPTLEPLP